MARTNCYGKLFKNNVQIRVAKNIIWTDDYNLGISSLDEQHKKFVGAIDKLYELITNQVSQDELKKIFATLIEYHNLHFSTEEKYFKEFAYEGAAEHMAEHKLFTQKVDDYMRRSNDGSYNIAFDLVDFLEDWLITHIGSTDKKYVKCFKEHGLI